MRQSGLILNDVSEACVTRPLVRDCYTTGKLNGLHETERFENGKNRIGNGTKCFENGTKPFGNGTLCNFGNGTLWPRFQFSPIFGFPRMANRPFVYLRYSKMRIKVHLICSCVIFFDLKKDM